MNVPIDPVLVRRLGDALDAPTSGYLAALDDLAESLVTARLDAARMVRGFMNRIADLGGSELEELYRQTFDRPSMGVERPSDVLRRLSYVDSEVQPDFVARVVTPALERALAVLEPERNPFALLVKAAFCLVLPAAGDTAALG